MIKAMSKKHETDGGREMKTLHSASLASETIPSRILLAPWGQVESTNGSFVVDDDAAQMAVAAFEEHGTDLPIDFEHQTLGGVYASPSGQAPAAFPGAARPIPSTGRASSPYAARGRDRSARRSQ